MKLPCKYLITVATNLGRQKEFSWYLHSVEITLQFSLFSLFSVVKISLSPRIHHLRLFLYTESLLYKEYALV